MADDLGGVWAFLGVARAGGFRSGAAALGLSQPAVSAAVCRLERDLGVPLFVKTGRRKVLSPAGKALVEVAGPALNEWARIEDRVQESVAEGPRGRLRVGAGESSLLYLLPDAVRAYRREYPEVELSLVSQPFQESLSMLREGSLDLAVRSLSRATPGLQALPLRDVPRVIVTSRREDPMLPRRPSLGDLAERPFVLPWRGSTTRALLESAFAGQGLTCRVALEAGGWEAVKLYVTQGVGVGLVPEIVVTRADRRRLAVFNASHLFPKERYGVLRAAERPLSRAGQVLVDVLRDHCAATTAGRRPGASAQHHAAARLDAFRRRQI